MLNPSMQDDTTTLLYSSGTMGPSKGVLSSHHNLISWSKSSSVSSTSKTTKTSSAQAPCFTYTVSSPLPLDLLSFA
ncbi:hypothetical protein PHAVU_003G133600 [Phaseolus vulgaris]|uniref:AMP-dependent synthetase/ligase domain-containing protein n=1 Tax=Phaseolus vulgaris TaxID=3885 RepID=V7CB73_PHAVU|nr:hypothetical protein PHAVU_003G133600g [Phaseolus vulgaris]ESW26608.1 hypothetical protein PHAVU_003G133600g [Phaseolus vulgaris]